MARVHIAIALTCLALGLLTTLYLLPHDTLALVGIPLAVLDWSQSHDALPRPATAGDYLLGVGKADITGPVVEINLMGYADPKQLGTGLKQRLYSRAFIVGSLTDPEERVVYLVVDTQSGDTAVRYGILQGLEDLGDEYAVYGPQNVAVTGTHSHSGPGAWLNYLLPQITSKGFDKQSYEAIVQGAVLSIQRAHESLQPGYLEVVSGDVLDANVNRSPYAYLANPAEEREKYEHNVDKTMTLLNFVRADDHRAIGSFNWFPVHGTSMLGNNTLISGDNKGVAASLLEHEQRTLGNAGFVAGFSQANVGDTSPNIMGAYCEDGSGTQCSFERSLCSNNKSEACHGRGPYFGLNDAGMKSCYEIGRRQFEGASKLMAQKDGHRIHGPIRSLHTFKDFSDTTFTLPNGSMVSTCSAALGYSFAAGTTDGPGAFDFKQNSRSPDANPVWAVVSKFIHAASQEQIACQAPKPILLDVGATTNPYQWTPNIVDIQLFRIGQLFVIVAPGEATTMSGRRWRDAIASEASALRLTSDLDETNGAGSDPIVVLGGPANSYAHYIATEEEYGVQRYEGASTLYGPHTLNAYINITTSLLEHLSSASPVKQVLAPGPQPPIHINSSLSFIRGVVFDGSGFTRDFGQVLTDVQPPSEHVYKPGEIVKVTFVGANPRNNLRLEGTFAMVEMQTNVELEDDSELKERFEITEDGWYPHLSDEDWELTYRWRRTNSFTATSEVDIVWEINEGTPKALYRMVYFGDSKALGGKTEAFVGRSGVFAVG